MAIQLDNRTKIIAGVAVLVFAGAGAWFFFFQDEAPPAKPAAGAAKAPADAAKSAAAPKAEAPKAEASKADAPKTAAGPKPPAKPVPTDPDQAVAEMMENTGAASQLQLLAAEAVKIGGDSLKDSQIKDPAAAKDYQAAAESVFEPKLLRAEVSANLKASFDAGRMPRYLELLRNPIALKMAALKAEALSQSADALKAQLDEVARNQPPAARMKLLERIEELNRNAGLGSQVGGVLGSGYIEGVLEQLQASKNAKTALTQLGNGDARNARPAMIARLNAKRGERNRDAVRLLAVLYRNASDAELDEYVKLIDTEIGEWGATTLAAALNPALDKRGREQGRAFAKYNFGAEPATSKTASAKAPAAADKPAAEEAKPAPVAAKPPAPPPGYERPANIRQLYTRYNDVLTAVVMRDRTAVKELLGDGKNPNARQSDGMTPLMVAVSNGDADLAEMLLAKGADPNLRATGGATALSIAKERRLGDLVRMLERAGAKI